MINLRISAILIRLKRFTIDCFQKMTKLIETWIDGQARIATFRDSKLIFIDGQDYLGLPSDWMFSAMHAYVKTLYNG